MSLVVFIRFLPRDWDIERVSNLEVFASPLTTCREYFDCPGYIRHPLGNKLPLSFVFVDKIPRTRTLILNKVTVIKCTCWFIKSFDSFLFDRRDGVVVRASASQSVDLGFIPLVESYQKTLKNGIYSFPAWRSAFMGGCGEQAGKFACCVLGQGT